MLAASSEMVKVVGKVLVPPSLNVAPATTLKVRPLRPEIPKPPLSNMPAATVRSPVTLLEVTAALILAPERLLLLVFRLL